MDEGGVLPPGSEIENAIGGGGVEFGEFFGEYFDGLEKELEGDFDDGGFVKGGLFLFPFDLHRLS